MILVSVISKDKGEAYDFPANTGGIIMYRSKKFFYNYEDYEENGKSAATMGEDILNDSELSSLEEIVIGSWGDSWEGSAQAFLDVLTEHADKLSHIKSLFVGDMDFEECEVSWIIQGNYEKLLQTLPNLTQLTIKGSTDLELGTISHENLTSLTIICGGLPASVIKSIETAHLPNLETLNLYLGVEDYGFDGSIDDIRSLLANSNFPKLSYLGLGDSEIEDDIVEAVLGSKYIHTIKTLDLSGGSLTDKGGQLLLEKLPSLSNLEHVNLSWHYLSDALMEKLEALPLDISLDDQQELEEYDGEIYCYPMLTE